MNEATDMMVDLNDYFDGGAEPYSFSLKAMPPATDFVTAKLEENMLTLKLTIPGGQFNADGSDGYTDGKSVTVVAVDADDATAEATVTVKPNRAPRPADGVSVDTDGAVTSDGGNLTLGTQDGDSMRTEGFYECEEFNKCVISIFQDDADVTRSVTEPASSSNFSVGKNEDGMIVLTGMASTWDAGADKPITVKIKAEDSNGLSSEATIMLSVNAQPTESEGAAAVVRTLDVGVGGDEIGTLTGDPDSLFADTEGNNLAITFATGNEAIATVTDVGVVTGVARGSATITATATSDDAGLAQTAEIEFSITVK
jgi:hypothetical protein